MNMCAIINKSRFIIIDENEIYYYFQIPINIITIINLQIIKLYLMIL